MADPLRRAAGPYVGSMATYQVTRVKSEPCAVDDHSRHILEAELHGADGAHRVATPVVRLMLSAGDNIVTQSAQSGTEADVRKGKCICGVKTIRSVNGTRTDDDMGSLPVYS